MSAIQVAGVDKLSFVSREMSRWMNRVMGPGFPRFHTRATWMPAVNLYEDALAYYVVADMAGVDPEGIDLRLERRQLVLRGERPTPRPPAHKCAGGGQSPPAGLGVSRPPDSPLRLHLMEIDHGSFARTLELPEGVDGNGIEACYVHGFLWVKMPKTQPPQSKPKE